MTFVASRKRKSPVRLLLTFASSSKRERGQRMSTLTSVWVLRGIASIAFGVLTVVWPRESLAALITLYGVYALVDGALFMGFAFRTGGGKGPYAWHGLVGIAAGALALAYPGLTAVSLYVLIG